MGARMCEANQKSLERILNEKALTGPLNELMDALAEYGFEGEVALNLEVSVVNKAFGSMDTTVSRSVRSRFK